MSWIHADGFTALKPLVIALLGLGLGLPGGLLCAQQQDANSRSWSDPAYSEFPMAVMYDVGVPLADGVRLSADIYRPVQSGSYPSILQHTPYNNKSSTTMEQAWEFVRRGYVYVTTDARGRYDSGGDFFPYRFDGPDGNEMMTWIASQPWSDGRIATFGSSYSGKNQWLMAREANPHHTAIVSGVAGADEFHDGARYNGVPKLDLRFTWLAGMYGRVNQPRAGWDWSAAAWQLPLSTMDQAVGRDLEPWRAYMEREYRDREFWRPLELRGSYQDFDIPSWSVTGWWDGQIRGAVQHHSESVRTGDPSSHALVIGPWLHGVNRDRQIGERDYGTEAIINLTGLRDEWLDHRLRDGPPPRMPNVLYFVQGLNEWRSADAWPIPDTRYTEFFFESGGSANTLFGDGTLRTGEPGRGPPDEFAYDPRNPVPTLSSRTSGARGGILQGSVDNRVVQTRSDVLVYTSDVLNESIEVSGPVTAHVFFSTDVPDTDITVKLLDVTPDGRALNVTHGIARARYRNSYTEPSLLEPGQVYEIVVELYPTSIQFERGHRIRVEVSSSNFPNFSRNLNTGASSETTTGIQTATTQIHHSPDHPSHILLPVVHTDATERWIPDLQ